MNYLPHIAASQDLTPSVSVRFMNDTETVGQSNPALVDMENIPLFTRFFTSQVVSRISSINSMI